MIATCDALSRWAGAVPSRLPIVQAPMAGGPSTPNLWAGAGWQAVTTEPAGQVVRRVAAQL